MTICFVKYYFPGRKGILARDMKQWMTLPFKIHINKFGCCPIFHFAFIRYFPLCSLLVFMYVLFIYICPTWLLFDSIHNLNCITFTLLNIFSILSIDAILRVLALFHLLLSIVILVCLWGKYLVLLQITESNKLLPFGPCGSMCKLCRQITI